MKPFRSRAVKASLPPLALGLAAICIWLSRMEKPASALMPQAQTPAESPAETSLPEMPVSETPLAGKPAAASSAPLSGLPPSEQESLQRAIFQAMHAIEPLTEVEAALPQNEDVSHFANNPSQKFHASFLKDGGVRLGSGLPDKTWQGTLRLADDNMHTPWKTEGTRAERTAGGVTEWYENRADGLEHGFTLNARPDDAREHGFRLDLALDGLQVEFDPDREGGLRFTDMETGAPVLAYRGLKVWDATGRELAAAMRPTGPGLRFTVRDGGAVYPVTIDPLIVSLEAKLGVGQIGNPVSAAIDGDVLAVGTDLLAVIVFRRQSGQWEMEAKLTPPDEYYDPAFGASLAVGDGTVLVGSPGAARTVPVSPSSPPVENAGVVHAYRRSGSAWAREITLKYDEAGGLVAPRRFGSQVAFDRGTGHILISAPGAGNVPGFPAVFVPSRFLYQGILDPAPTVIPAPGPVRMAIDNGISVASRSADVRVHAVAQPYGASVALTPAPGPADDARVVDISGNTIVVGSRTAAPDGKVFVYRRDGDAWSLSQTIDAPQGRRQFGTSVAIEGNALMVADGNEGSWLYTRAEEGAPWTGTFLLLGDGQTHLFPSLVAMSPDSAVTVLTGREPALRFLDRVQGAWTAGPSAVLGGSSRPSDHFGLHVALDGEVAVVGALDHAVAGGLPSAGKAWIFRRSGGRWKPEASLINHPPAANDRFGVAVAVAGNVVAVGADYDDEDGKTNCGSVSVFNWFFDDWQHYRKLSPAPAGAQLGRSVAVGGGTIAGGAPGHESGRGAVWTWVPDGTPGGYRTVVLTAATTDGAADRQAQANFGFSVAISGRRLIAGEPGWDHQDAPTGQVTSNAGRVSFFKADRPNIFSNLIWDPKPVTVASGTIGQLRSVGFSVAMDGDVAVAGNTSPAGWFTGATARPNDGSAYVFTHNGTAWSSAPVASLDGGGFATGTGTYFGSSVAVRGDVIAVGAFGHGGAAGRVRLFQKQGASWVKHPNDLVAPVGERAFTDAFGISTALSGDTLLVGAYGVNSEAGIAYVYRVTEPDAGPNLLKIAPPAPGSGTLRLTWPEGTGLALWQSPTMADGTWSKVTTTDGSYDHPISTDPGERMFFRLAPP